MNQKKLRRKKGKKIQGRDRRTKGKKTNPNNSNLLVLAGTPNSSFSAALCLGSLSNLLMVSKPELLCTYFKFKNT